MIGALVLPVIIPGAGMGIDMIRAMTLKQNLQHSIDSTSQTMTQRLNLCLDRVRTQSGGLGSDTQDLDRGCLNDEVFTGGLKASAQTLLTSNFTQKGYVTPPQISGEVTIDQITGAMNIQGNVTYKCFFMKLFDPNGCLVTAQSSTKLVDAFAQARPLKINVPNNVFDIWALETNQPNPPAVVTASDGWLPYAFAGGSNMPVGLRITSTTDTTAQIQGRPQDIPCDTANCAPQLMPPTAISVMDNGDDNRSDINRQTDVGYIRFRMIHELKMTLDGRMGEDGLRDAPNLRTDTKGLRPGVFQYGAEPIVTGGLGPYRFTCSGAPRGVGHRNFSCDPNTGVIDGMPYLDVNTPEVTGTYSVTVTDARGKTATDTRSYRYILPRFYGSGNSITGEFGKNFDAYPVFRVDGGYTGVRIRCENLPAQVYCGGNGADTGGVGTTWGYFDGAIRGQPVKGTAAEGVIVVVATDTAGRETRINVPYKWTVPTDIDMYDCGDGVTQVSAQQLQYNSVHDKYGSGIVETVYFTCGAGAQAGSRRTGLDNVWGPWGNEPRPGLAYGQGIDYGLAIPGRYISKDQMMNPSYGLLAMAQSVCTRANYDINYSFEGRQGSGCFGAGSTIDVTNMGVVANIPPYAPPPSCVRFSTQDGFGGTTSLEGWCPDGTYYLIIK